jgi:hypothetical protein
VLAKHTMDGGPGDAVVLRQLSETLTAPAVSHDSFTIEIKWLTSDVTTLELGAPHAGADALDDQVAFQFGDRSDDDHDSPAQGAAGVDLFAERDELDVEPVQLVEHFQEVLHRPGDSIACPDQHDIESTVAGIAHQLVKTRAGAPSRH